MRRSSSGEVRAAIGRLRDRGIPLLNQSVLLKGVNDSVDVLVGLNQELEANGVQPYYLHHTDRAPGTQKFWVEIERGLDIHRELSRRVRRPPRYVIDPPDGSGKIPVAQWAARSTPRPVPSAEALGRGPWPPAI